jgi:hypothetical protein
MLRCYYNFMRPHLALKFGKEIRTPAMQACLCRRRLNFRDVFTNHFFVLIQLFKIRIGLAVTNRR